MVQPNAKLLFESDSIKPVFYRYHYTHNGNSIGQHQGCIVLVGVVRASGVCMPISRVSYWAIPCGILHKHVRRVKRVGCLGRVNK